MKKFEGIYTALLTPFDENGRINENALSDLIEYNLLLRKHIRGVHADRR